MQKEQTNHYRPPVLSVWALLLMVLPMICLAEVDTSLAESLRKSLELQGWQEYQADDGSVIYRQPVLPNEPDIQPSVSAEGQRDRLKKALGERGWEAEWNPEGVLILKPQAKKSPSTSVSPSTGTADQAGLIPDLPGFEYWRIVKSDDGSMLFYPLSISQDTETSPAGQNRLERCQGHQPNMDKISLPVDQWTEANVLAQNWITASGLEGLIVGRIRKVLRVYLVSLVAAAAPYGLEHQLAIRVSDGRVMLLD